MTTRERSILKRLAVRVRNDSAFAEKVARDPQRTLRRYALTASQKAAVSSLAMAVMGLITVRPASGWW